MRNNPNYFHPCGVSCFCGSQGSGKTYSAIVYTYQLMKMFPACICVTNMRLYGRFAEYHNRIFRYQDVSSLTYYNNGTDGVIFLLDELHLEFNSLKSKEMPDSLFYEISQQRKQRKHIVGTSQLYSRLAKPFREQMDEVIQCRNYFGLLQHNYCFDGWTLKQDDGELHGECKRQYFLFHDPAFYDSFDTFAKINTKMAAKPKKGGLIRE